MELTNLKRQSSRLNNRILERLESIILRANFIQGEEVQELERKLSEYTASPYIVTCGNGTDALQLALMSLNINKGDYVICPAYTFVATAEVIPLAGGIPYFVDVEKDTFNISIEKLKESIEDIEKKGKNIAAIISVDLFGLPVDYDELIDITRKKNITLIADCAQSFGAKYKNNSVLSLADISTTSFFPSKPLGCYGDGGAIFTSSDKQSKIIKSLSVHGKGDNKYDNVRIGINSRLDTFQAAVLIEKLSIFEEELILRNEIAKKYNSLINSKYDKPLSFENKYSAWAQYTLITPEYIDRNEVQKHMTKEGISTAIFYPKPLHMQIAYQSFPKGDCSNSDYLSKHSLSIPFSPYLNEEEISLVADVLNTLIQS